MDGTGKKVYPMAGVRARFTSLLRDSYDVFGPIAMPWIDLKDTAWPVRVQGTTRPDVADVIYGVHRCTHGHGDELPDGFELIHNAGGPIGTTDVYIERGKVRLSDRVIFGLVAVAVLSPANIGQTVPTGYHLTFENQRFEINEWWGRYDDFRSIVRARAGPNVRLDFGDWHGPA